MQVLVIGSGGREHALAWAISRSPQVEQVHVASGNGGTQWQTQKGETRFSPHAPSRNVPIAPDDIEGLLKFTKDHAINLTVVGPEVPLAMGIVDRFQAAGLRIFGASKATARLEASKAFSKRFMEAHNIPTADALITRSFDEAFSYILQKDVPLVVKADGLAAGKGVIVCDTSDEAIEACQFMLNEGGFGEASQTIVIEERLAGREISVLAFCDGKTVKTMPVARDHKRALEGDKGGNTGGMGAFAPTDDISQALIDEVVARVIQPTIDGMADKGTPYVGVLYAGIMLTPEGIMTLEFNCRFGDPETQVILPLLKTDIITVFNACIDGTLAQCPIEWHEGYTACVVLASEGYPNDYPKGHLIRGLSDLKTNNGVVFHAGTAQRDGKLVTSGGRVLNVTSHSDTLEQALDDVYTLIESLYFDGMHYRKDIGKTAQKDTP